MTYVPMIDPDTGEIDHAAIAERAPLRAAREYGSPNFPPSYLRDATEWLKDRASAERLCWRRDHNMPDDTVYVTVSVPDWGASGDSFARVR